MSLRESEIEDLAARILAGAEEAFAAEVAAALIDDYVHGVVNATTAGNASVLAAAERSRLDTILMRHRGKASEQAMAEVRSALAAADARDAAALGLGTAGRQQTMIAEQAARGVAEAIARDNVALVDRAAETWYRVAAEAILAAETGGYPAGGAVERAVLELSRAGIETIDYRSGVKSQLDVAVKRHMRTQVVQASAEMTLARLGESGDDLVCTTAHFGAREDHAVWQGKAFSLSGPQEVDGVHYPDFYASTGYGTVTGLCGANCRHHFDVYVPGVSTLPELPDTFDGMTGDEYYEATQRQRELERRVRKTKREVAALERAGIGLESPTYVQKRLLLGRQQAALREHCRDKGLLREGAREKAYGIGAQPRALRSPAWRTRTRDKRKLSSGRYAVTQEEINVVIERDLPNVKLPCEITYNPRLRYSGTTKYEEVYPGFNRLLGIEIGPQKNDDDAELRDTILHEILEARIILRAGALYEGGDAIIHPYIDKVIAKYVKMKGL